MNTTPILIAALLLTNGSTLLRAANLMDTLHGDCVISSEDQTDRARLKLERGDCKHDDCHDQNNDEPWSVITGFSMEDLRHEGAHAEAVISAEAGKLTCSGTVHDLRLFGDYTFVPDPSFVQRMNEAGFHGLDSEKLMVYTIFQIQMSWIKSLQQAGVTEMDADNVIALRIFRADASYVRELAGLGYAAPEAGKLIAFRVHGVDPAEIKQVRALGLNPSMDELIQMRIFKVTPDFIKRMQAKNLGDLTISKLVQIRIFKLAE
jgi:hypothetical protein